MNTVCFVHLRPLEDDMNLWNLPKCIFRYPRTSGSTGFVLLAL